MTPVELDEALSELELRLERLRALYEQYFLGIEKVPPGVQRKDVDRRVHNLRREQIRNTAKRFKLQTLIQRYNTFQQYWMRICREIEEGTYKRHVERARRRADNDAALTIAARRRFGRRKQVLDEETDNAAEKAAKATEELEMSLSEALGLARDRLQASVPPTTARSSPASDPKGAGALSGSSQMSTMASNPTGLRTSAGTRASPLSLSDNEANPAPRSTPLGSLSIPPRPTRVVAPKTAQREADRSTVAGLDQGKAHAHRPTIVATPRTLAQAALAREGRDSPSSAQIGPAAPTSLASSSRGGKTSGGLAPAAQQPSSRLDPVPASSHAHRATSPAAQRAPAILSSGDSPRRGVPVPSPGKPTTAKSPNTSESRASAGLSSTQVQELHRKLVAAKRQTNDAAPVSADRLGRKLEATAAKLRAAHGNRRIDFDVVIRDGRAIIKPIVR